MPLHPVKTTIQVDCSLKRKLSYMTWKGHQTASPLMLQIAGKKILACTIQYNLLALLYLYTVHKRTKLKEGERKKTSNQIIEILIGSPGKSTLPRYYRSNTLLWLHIWLSVRWPNVQCMTHILKNSWPACKAGWRAASGFIWQAYCSMQYEILTPITGRRHLIISRFSSHAWWRRHFW